jgi:hypothetical protein
MHIIHLGFSFVSDMLKSFVAAAVTLIVAVLGIWGIVMHLLRRIFVKLRLRIVSRIFFWLAWPTQKAMDWYVPKLVKSFPALSSILALKEGENGVVENANT